MAELLLLAAGAQYQALTEWHDQRSGFVLVYIGKLRRKIEEDPARPRYIISEPGVGYRLL